MNHRISITTYCPWLCSMQPLAKQPVGTGCFGQRAALVREHEVDRRP